jgi:hypothetical protein
VKNRFQSLPFKCNLQRYTEYKDNVDQRLILPGVNWKESASVGKNVAASK